MSNETIAKGDGKAKEKEQERSCEIAGDEEVGHVGKEGECESAFHVVDLWDGELGLLYVEIWAMLKELHSLPTVRRWPEASDGPVSTWCPTGGHICSKKSINDHHYIHLACKLGGQCPRGSAGRGTNLNTRAAAELPIFAEDEDTKHVDVWMALKARRR
ncbi:hypothetical protein M413DRAFT_14588 [Hebeloma cylindrosporum]|uniref:Uncharacterized protein n=1 Tax=Hebeloma cylindrosporum TaxID=76867 RepID=A0A0C3BF07_HEBCY|nr:hypothetical protein M413DRAFT_14588 [Hebeloma cylindrosporum h7]